jgi:YD repeat-containing protein
MPEVQCIRTPVPPTLAPRRCRLGAWAILFVLLQSASAWAQETRFIYDAAGRLIAVVDSQGRATIYDYDEAGNITAVRRPQPSDPVAITFVSPPSGIAGTVVEIVGVGFGATPAANQVRFNGVPAVVTGATTSRLTAVVPAGATTGPITVSTSLGSATSPSPFVIYGLTVQPTQATVVIGRTRQFTAATSGLADTAVVWSVEGVPGGNVAVGTVSPTGLYTAPIELTAGAAVRVQARSVRFPQLVAAATVALVPPSTAVVASPADIRVVRVGMGDANGLAANTTVASPREISVVRIGLGESGGLQTNTTVAAPFHLSVVRPGMGDVDGLPPNVTIAVPSALSVTRLGLGDGGLPENTTTAAPVAISVTRPGMGGANGEAANVTVAQPTDVRVRRPE